MPNNASEPAPELASGQSSEGCGWPALLYSPGWGGTVEPFRARLLPGMAEVLTKSQLSSA
jgi:hypothetical protein